MLLGMAGMANAQEKEAKLHTYVMEKPYDVQKILPPEGKKVKNVILMIGDGMSIRLGLPIGVNCTWIIASM